MSGHSKWHNIQKTKGAADAKRAQAFTKIAREMIVAVKEGGSGDPNNNSRLAAVITKAKAGTLNDRRLVIARIPHKEAVTKLFNELGPKYADRNGGYTRIIRTGIRRGDAAETAIIELV